MHSRWLWCWLPPLQDENKAYQMQLQFLEHVPLMKRLPKEGWEPGVDFWGCLLLLVRVAPFKPVVTPPSSGFLRNFQSSWALPSKFHI